ncbi:MAG: TolB family protein [Bacteroidales bacterium]
MLKKKYVTANCKLSRTLQLVFFAFAWMPAMAQDLSFEPNAHQRLQKADILFFNENFSDALKLYEQLYAVDTSNRYLKFKIAQCYSYLPQSKEKEIKLFCNVLGLPYPSSMDNTYVYKGYMSWLNVDSGALVTQKRQNIKPYRFNTKETFDNFCISEDSRYLVFVNTTSSKNQIYFLQRVGKQWTNAENITSQVGSMGDCFPSFISKDGKRLYLTRYDGFDSEIYVSTYDGVKWSLMKKLNNNINSTYWDAHACESPDGMILYFASNRPDGYGGMDIYYSIKVDGDWKKATNAGNRINTALDEDYPLLVNNGRTLIYASQGFSKGAQKLDLMYAQFVADFIWSEPKELGYPFNTADDDFSYVPLDELARAFLYQNILGPRKKISYELYLKTEIDVKNDNAKYIGTKRMIIRNMVDPQDTKSAFIEPGVKYTSVSVVPGLYTIEFKGDGLESRNINLLVPAVAIPDTMQVKVILQSSTNPQDLKNTNIWKPLEK